MFRGKRFLLACESFIVAEWEGDFLGVNCNHTWFSGFNDETRIGSALYMLNLTKARCILLAFLLGLTPSLVAQSISITIAPPPLPVYEQPSCPGDGFLWVPGYWAYGDDGYFWVPGVWFEPPQ